MPSSAKSSMPRDLLLYLEDIRDAVASIRSYVGDRTFEEFVGDRMCLDAVVPQVHHHRGGDKADPRRRVTARHPEIEWRKIAGLRDISVHSYYAVKPTILWEIIQTRLGPLEDAVEAMIQEEGG